MAGRGSAPKPPEQRARKNKDVVPLKALPLIVDRQPTLPRFQVKKSVQTGDGQVEKAEMYRWSPRTVAWWKMWSESALARDFTANDWSELLDTALIHSEYWKGDLKLASELRLRTAKFGATPEDRARLRITFAQAIDAEVEATKKVISARDRAAGVQRKAIG